jgi:hypothetical protein
MLLNGQNLALIMTTLVQLATILTPLGIAIVGLLTIRANRIATQAAVVAVQTRTIAEESHQTAVKAVSVAEGTQKTLEENTVSMTELAVNTNSIKDELVRTTELLGVASGRAQVQAELDRAGRKPSDTADKNANGP